MCVKVSARLVAGRFYLYLAGRKVGEAATSGGALDWLSRHLREPRCELSSLSDLTGADVAAYRARLAADVEIDGAGWRVA